MSIVVGENSPGKKVAIDFTDEQGQLLDIAENFVREKSDIAKVRSLLDDKHGYDQAVWDEMVALGWLGIAVPEEFGGSGLGIKEVISIVEPIGKGLLATPLLSTTQAAQTILIAGTDAQKSTWLPKICEGAVVSLALTEEHGDYDLANVEALAVRDGDQISLSGKKTFVAYAGRADAIIASVMLDGQAVLVLIEQSAIPQGAIVRETGIDETRRTGRLSLDGISIPSGNLLRLEDGDLKKIELISTLLLCAEMAGSLGSCLNYVVEYLQTRKQFGKLIGSYQSLKHPTVQILTGLEGSRSHVYYAASTWDQGDDETEVEIAVRMAKAFTSDAFSFAGDRAIQFHGGFGFTYDCDAQLYRRRAIWSENQFGDALYQRRKLADLLLN